MKQFSLRKICLSIIDIQSKYHCLLLLIQYIKIILLEFWGFLMFLKPQGSIFVSSVGHERDSLFPLGDFRDRKGLQGKDSLGKIPGKDFWEKIPGEGFLSWVPDLLSRYSKCERYTKLQRQMKISGEGFLGKDSWGRIPGEGFLGKDFRESFPFEGFPGKHSLRGNPHIPTLSSWNWTWKDGKTQWIAQTSKANTGKKSNREILFEDGLIVKANLSDKNIESLYE